MFPFDSQGAALISYPHTSSEIGGLYYCIVRARNLMCDVLNLLKLNLPRIHTDPCASQNGAIYSRHAYFRK
jgi:hypothetical protein